MNVIVDVRVKNLQRAIEFYTKKLELDCRRDKFYVEDLDKGVTKLKEKGVEFFSDENMPNFVSVDENQITEFPWGRTAFFKDSEGNELALVRDL